MLVTSAVCRHFGNDEQPKNALPALEPRLACRTISLSPHFGHVG
jgi:hypothetical protein